MIYELNEDKKNYRKVKRIRLKEIGWKEENLQNLLSENIQDLIYTNELMVIFNERKRQEEPDIIALDKKGNLYILELKRWSSKEENLLQVLRYGQLFGNSSYSELDELYKKYTGDSKDLKEMHKNYFNLEENSSLKSEEFNQKQNFLIVTNGLDQKTVEAIAFWKKNGLNIDAIVYWVFEINKRYFIEFNMYSPIENFLEYESNCYILNTNFSNSKQHHEDMLKEQKAAAYYPGWREKIQKLQEGDTVFLYKNGEGIVAYGEATGKLEKKDCDGKKDFEYFMKLRNFRKLKKPLSASKIKEIINTNFSFRGTMFSVNEERKKKILKTIKKDYQ